MTFWSTGTGQQILSLPLGDAVPSVKEGKLVFKGKMGAPVFWDYTINLSEEDFISFFGLAKNQNTVDFLLSSKIRIKVFFTIAIASVRFILKTVPRLGLHLIGLGKK